MEDTFAVVVAALMGYDAVQAYFGGVSRSTVKHLVATKQLRKCKIGRRTLFRKDDLDAYIKHHTPADGAA